MARIKGPKKTNRYPDEFKIKAVQLADHVDILAKDVARFLGINTSAVNRLAVSDKLPEVEKYV